MRSIFVRPFIKARHGMAHFASCISRSPLNWLSPVVPRSCLLCLNALLTKARHGMARFASCISELPSPLNHLLCLLCLLWLNAFLTSPASAAEIRVEGDLALAVDVCRYRGDDGPYQEVVVCFPASNLTREVQGDSLVVARYAPRLNLFHAQGNAVKEIAGERVVSVNEQREICDIARFRVPPGAYRAELEVNALGNNRQGRAVFPIVVREYKTGQLALSDLFFVREIDPPGEQFESFRKAGHVLLPAPAREFSDVLRYYVELYEIGRVAHRVRFQVLDRFGHRVFDHEREYPAYREDAKFAEGIRLRALPPGEYALRVEAQAGEQLAHTQRAFRISGSPESPTMPIRAKMPPEIAAHYAALGAGERAVFAYGYFLEHQPAFAYNYIAPAMGLADPHIGLSLLRAIGLGKILKKRVDKTFGERLPVADTLAVREAQGLVDFVLDDDPRDPYALTAKALLALETGAVARGEAYARKALEVAPGLPDVQRAIGIAKLARRDWEGAAQHFQRAAQPGNVALARFLAGKGVEHLQARVAQRPDHPYFHYAIGRVKERGAQLEESAASYRRQLAVNPLFARAKFDFGRVLFKRGRIDSAAAVWRELMEARPSFRKICVHPLLAAYLNIGETGKAQAVISEELRTLSDEARARVEDISLVAGPEERAEYQRLPPEARPQFVRAFWQKRDPTPATPGNERLVEHYRRVVYALDHYSKDGQTWDRRGDVYIRYGDPAHISTSSDIRFETDREVVRVKERLAASLSAEAKQEILARIGRLRTSTRDVEIESELAEVVGISDFESIDFEMNPNRVFFAAGSDDGNAYVRGKELFGRDRPGMSERPLRGIPLYPVNGSEPWAYWIYPNVAGGIEVVFNALTPRGDFDFPDVSQGRKLARFNQRLWEDVRPEAVITRAIAAQPDRYAPVNALEFHYAYADFRGTGERSRVEVYYGVPVLDAVDGKSEVAFERGIALFDSAWAPVYRKVAPMPVQVDTIGIEAGTLAIDELALALRPGKYYLGLQIDHPASARSGGYTQELIVEDYAVPGLKISDIELAGRVQVDSLARVEVVALPSRTYKAGQPIVIYYEVYDLHRDELGRTQYRVDYRITPKQGKLSGVRVLRAIGRLLGIEEKAVVTISYHHAGNAADEYNYLEIDPGDSQPGACEIAVTVTDLNTGQRAEKTAMFFIGD